MGGTTQPMTAPVELRSGISAASAMSTEGQRVDDSPSTSGGSSDGDQREGVQQEQEREQVQPKKKEGKISSKTAAKLSTSAKRNAFWTPIPTKTLLGVISLVVSLTE
ncbi:hypothetical protein BTVI_93766 [Pitangus sulphuratus]|nr:hypothetical protein BTVI_93766 [Pitangus sulphuratus]